jgi:hypothetical protein
MAAGPAVIVNGRDDAIAALRAARGAPITLLSAPGSALFAGCLWWREIVREARDAVPDANATDILDCADASGLAVSALRLGQQAVVLSDQAPGYSSVLAIAQELGARVLPIAPPALDLAERGAARHLEAWLAGDTRKTVG